MFGWQWPSQFSLCSGHWRKSDDSHLDVTDPDEVDSDLDEVEPAELKQCPDLEAGSDCDNNQTPALQLDQGYIINIGSHGEGIHEKDRIFVMDIEEESTRNGLSGAPASSRQSFNVTSSFSWCVLHDFKLDIGDKVKRSYHLETVAEKVTHTVCFRSADKFIHGQPVAVKLSDGELYVGRVESNGFGKRVEDWRGADVGEWLSDMGLDSVPSLARELHDRDGRTLLKAGPLMTTVLNEEDLYQLGMALHKSFGVERPSPLPLVSLAPEMMMENNARMCSYVGA